MSHAFHRRAALRTLLSLLGASLPALASTRAPRTEPIRLALIERGELLIDPLNQD